MFLRITVATLLLCATPLQAAPSGFTPKAPKLTRADVERLIVLIPKLAKESSQLESNPAQSMNPMAGASGSKPQIPIEDLKRIEALLKKHGYTFPDFFMQLTTLVSTYLALTPEAFEKQLPREDTPEIKKILDDPNIAQVKKDQLRKQIADAHANKDMIRKQMTAFATEENKRVVRPLLAKVQKALETAEREATKAQAARAKKAAQ